VQTPHSTTPSGICSSSMRLARRARFWMRERREWGGVEELALGPNLAEAKLEEAARSLNTNDGGGAGVERQSDAGLSERGHAYREQAPSEMEKPS
jgi:hypothetical protein